MAQTSNLLRRGRIVAPVFFASYLAWTAAGSGLRAEHILISVFFIALFAINDKTARFATLVLPFLGVGILYENMGPLFAFRGDIHVADLYRAELSLFSVQTASGPQILPHWFNANPSTALDLLCGFAYATYLVEVFGFAIFLYFVDQARLSKLAWAWLLINVMGIATWVLWPAAPPWYVQDYGLGPAVMDALPSPVGTARFDALLGINYFQAFYARSANVFGAMPSLHCGYPTVVLCATVGMKRRWTVGALTFLSLVAFSAIYLNHHYVLDAVAGVFFGVGAYSCVVFVTNELTKRFPTSDVMPAVAPEGLEGSGELI